MKLYVGNLPFSATEDDISALFEPYGPVNEVIVVLDKFTGRPRGFAFVTLANRDAGQQAIEKLNGSDFGGRALKINEARPREEGGQGGGGFGGGDRRPPRSGGNGGGRSFSRGRRD